MWLLSSIEPDLINERKFTGPVGSLPFVLALLDARCTPDARYPAGRVNSVYFDTMGKRAYWEKANSDNLKMKVRLRWYGRGGDLSGDIPAFLELKYRLGSARRKVRLHVLVSADWLCRAPLCDVSFRDFLAGHEQALGAAVGMDWTPTVCVSYDRVRYDDPVGGSRISVDGDIRADRFNADLFPWATPVALNAVVCEFKNRGGVPPVWADEMARARFRLGSFSKYGECISRLMDGVL